jgi:hypothetical protein
MKSFIKVLSIFIMICSLGCKPEPIQVSEVISSLTISDRTPFADGKSVIDISVKINTETNVEKRNVVFSCSSGTFLPSNDTVITQKAVFENGNLIARVKYRVTSTAEKILVTARPESRSRYEDFLVGDSIVSKVSIPTFLKLTSSAPAVFEGYQNEVQLTGILRNDLLNVSSGLTVLFEDYYEDGSPVNGRYRAKRELTDSNSMVSTYYSPGFVQTGKSIYLKCTYLENKTKKTYVKDSCLITIIKP